MPDHEYPTPANAFDPDYLNQLAQRDDPVTAGEAVTGGFWRVVPLDDERFGLFRMWESPECSATITSVHRRQLELCTTA
jgi:hypothetical protein